MTYEVSAEMRARWDREVAKYPPEQRISAVMACLAIIQQEQGHVSAAAEAALATYLRMEPIAVHEVTTFYNMYNQQPVGRFKLNENRQGSLLDFIDSRAGAATLWLSVITGPGLARSQSTHWRTMRLAWRISSMRTR